MEASAKYPTIEVSLSLKHIATWMWNTGRHLRTSTLRLVHLRAIVRLSVGPDANSSSHLSQLIKIDSFPGLAHSSLTVRNLRNERTIDIVEWDERTNAQGVRLRQD